MKDFHQEQIQQLKFQLIQKNNDSFWDVPKKGSPNIKTKNKDIIKIKLIISLFFYLKNV